MRFGLIVTSWADAAATQASLAELDQLSEELEAVHIELDEETAAEQGWQTAPGAIDGRARLFNGIAHSLEADWYIFCSPPLRGYPGWLAAMAEALAEAPDIWAASPWCYDQPVETGVEYFGQPLVNASEVAERQLLRRYAYDVSLSGPLFVKAEVFAELGGFDEALHGETHLTVALRQAIWAAGRKVARFHRAVVWSPLCEQTAPFVQSLNKNILKYRWKMVRDAELAAATRPSPDELLPAPWCYLGEKRG